MKYIGGKSRYDSSAQEWKYEPRVYTDFYCSLKEWHSLGRGKMNYIKQLVMHASLSEDETEDDFYSSLWYSKERQRIISNAINLITHRRPKVTNYWEDETLSKDYLVEKNDHIEIEFPELKMPNIIILYDKWEETTGDGFFETVKDCIDCVYKVLELKTLDYYDNYLYQFFNNDYDYVFFKGDKDSCYYNYWNGKWSWKDVIKRKDERIYTEYKSLLYKVNKIKIV